MFPPVTLPRSSQRVIRHAGADYQLQVAWPASPPPPGGYPVVYLLDAHAGFATAAESERARSHRTDATGVPPTVVVGISLGGERVDKTRRTFDFTRPGLALPESERQAGVAAPETGGAEAMTDLLTNVVMPTVESEHPIDTARRMLFGHSLSGLFVVEVLLADPFRFGAFVAASPSLWWDPDGIADRAAALVDRTRSEAPHVLLTAGSFEETLPPRLVGRPEAPEILARRQRRRMVGRIRDLARQLAPLTAHGGSARALVFAGEDHASVLPLTINEALRIW